MKILLTNDDGVESEGLSELFKALNPGHEVWILAPDSERSGISHAMSLKTPCKIRKLDERVYSCSGMPADCVILTHLGVMPFKPDIVISGINRGPNLGTDLIYSGTASGARQAAMFGWPGIAVSLDSHEPPFNFFKAASFISDRINELVELWDPRVFININIPNCLNAGTNWDFADPSVRTYHDSLKRFDAPDSYSYCFLTDGKIETHNRAENSDFEVVKRGIVAISRILVQPSADNSLPIHHVKNKNENKS